MASYTEVRLGLASSVPSGTSSVSPVAAATTCSGSCSEGAESGVGLGLCSGVWLEEEEPLGGGGRVTIWLMTGFGLG